MTKDIARGLYRDRLQALEAGNAALAETIKRQLVEAGWDLWS